MSDFTFGPAREEHKEVVLALYKSLLGTPYCLWNEYYPSMDEIEKDLLREDLFCLWDKETDALAGVISVDLDPEIDAYECWSKELVPARELARLGVATEYQNRGIAKRLILSAMDVLRERGYKGVHFLVGKENLIALRAYEKLHFHNVGEHELWGHDYRCYEKEL